MNLFKNLFSPPVKPATITNSPAPSYIDKSDSTLARKDAVDHINNIMISINTLEALNDLFNSPRTIFDPKQHIKVTTQPITLFGNKPISIIYSVQNPEPLYAYFTAKD